MVKRYITKKIIREEIYESDTNKKEYIELGKVSKLINLNQVHKEISYRVLLQTYND